MSGEKSVVRRSGGYRSSTVFGRSSRSGGRIRRPSIRGVSTLHRLRSVLRVRGKNPSSVDQGGIDPPPSSVGPQGPGEESVVRRSGGYRPSTVFGRSSGSGGRVRRPSIRGVSTLHRLRSVLRVRGKSPSSVDQGGIDPPPSSVGPQGPGEESVVRRSGGYRPSTVFGRSSGSGGRVRRPSIREVSALHRLRSVLRVRGKSPSSVDQGGIGPPPSSVGPQGPGEESVVRRSGGYRSSTVFGRSSGSGGRVRLPTYTSLYGPSGAPFRLIPHYRMN